MLLVVYVVYYFSAFSTVPGGDSGELLADACVSTVMYTTALTFLDKILSHHTATGHRTPPRLSAVYYDKPCGDFDSCPASVGGLHGHGVCLLIVHPIRRRLEDEPLLLHTR